MADATEVTFEAGCEELKSIVARLDAEDVSVHEMCELFARGKGLEKALRGYLTTQQGKLDEIEVGENLPEFAIVAPAGEPELTAARLDAPAEPAGSDSRAARPTSATSRPRRRVRARPPTTTSHPSRRHPPASAGPRMRSRSDQPRRQRRRGHRL